MTHFAYRHGTLHADDLPLADVAAQYGTPCYVYAESALREAYASYARSFHQLQPLICYAMKANPNLSILRLFAELGAGFDIVSGGELSRVLAAGGDPSKVIFSGVGKSAQEMADALRVGIRCFNVESAPELARLNTVAGELGLRAPISLRVNPDVDANTHPYISTGLKGNKFGVAFDDALATYQQAAAYPHLDVIGIDCHIGSQITELAPFVDALDRVLHLVDQLAAQGITLHHLDLGGGVGIRYLDETPIHLPDYAAAIEQRLQGRSLELLLEPGRSLVGNAGLLLTRIEYLKPGEARNFAIVDAAMNDLMRPALYDAWHTIQAVKPRNQAEQTYSVVGPICESGDFLGHDRALAVEAGDLLAVMSAGAYGMAMSSNYNSRGRAAEVMVQGRSSRLIRSRETMDQQLANELGCLD